MRYLTHLRNAYKITHLTYPRKIVLSYASVALDCNQTRSYGSKASGTHNDEEAFRDALAVLSSLKDNSYQVESFSDACTKLKFGDRGGGGGGGGGRGGGGGETRDSSGRHNQMDQTSKSIESDTSQVKITTKVGESKGQDKNLSFRLSKNMENQFKGIPVSAMQLNFEMDMTNVKDALLNPDNVQEFKVETKNLPNSKLALSTQVRVDPTDAITIPLHFNAIIRGTVDINPKEFAGNKLTKLEVPQFNEYVTAVAANLCSTALQKGFPSNASRRNNSTKKENKSANKSKMNDVRVRRGYENFEGDLKKSEKTINTEGPLNDEAVITLFRKSDRTKAAAIEGSNTNVSKAGKSLSLSAVTLSGAEKPKKTLNTKQNRVSVSENAVNAMEEAISPYTLGLTGITVSRKQDATAKPPRSPHIVCVRKGDKGCQSPGLAGNKPYVKVDSQSKTATGSAAKLGLLDCKLYKKSKEQAECKREERSKRDTSSWCGSTKSNVGTIGALSSKSKSDSCKKSGSPSSWCGSTKSNVGTIGALSSKSKSISCMKSASSSKCGGAKKSTSSSKCGGAKKSSSSSKCGGAKKSSSASKCGGAKKSSSASKCGGAKKALPPKCGGAKKSASTSKCGSKSSSASKCGGGAKKDPCKKSSASKCGSKSSSASKCGGAKKSASASKCGSKSSSASKCGGAKKSASASKCGGGAKKDPCKKSSASKCGSKSSSASKCGGAKKSASTSKCGGGAKKDPCKKSSASKCGGGAKKSASASKCGSKSSSASKCGGAKKSASTSKCGGGAKKDPCKKSSASKCGGGAKKSASASKCGSKSSSASKCGSKSSSASKCGGGAKKDPCKKSSASKCGGAKKDPCKKSSASKCGASKKDPCKKSSSASKCGSKSSSASKCGGGAKKDPCKKSSASKCGGAKKDPCKKSSASKCGASKKDPCKKSSSASKCGSKSSSASKCGGGAKKDPCKKSSASKCGSKSSSASKCGGAKKSSSGSKCGSKSSSASKCGGAKKSSSTSKCGSKKALPPKCGGAKKSSSSSKCGGAKKALPPKCGGGKKSSSGSKCGSKSSLTSKCGGGKKDPGKKSSSTKCGKCGDSKDTCKKSSASKCGEAKKSSCKKSSDSKCGKSKSKTKSDCSPTSKCSTLKNPAQDSKNPCRKSSSSCRSRSKLSDASYCARKSKSLTKPKWGLKGKPPKMPESTMKACKRSAQAKCANKSRKELCEYASKDSNLKETKKPMLKCGQTQMGSTRPNCGKAPAASASRSSGSCSSKSSIASAKSKSSSISSVSSKGSKSSSTSRKPKSGGGKSSGSKKGFHTLAMLSNLPSIPSPFGLKLNTSCCLIFARNYSDDRDECPKKSKKGKKDKFLEEYREGECKKHSWADDRHRSKYKKPNKNCYPEENAEFCPDTSCFRIMEEAEKKTKKKREQKCKSSKKPKENKTVNVNTLCTMPTKGDRPLLLPANRLAFHVCDKSTSNSTNQEAVIKEPYKIITGSPALPHLKDDDVLVRVGAVSLCDSDIFMFETGARNFPTHTLGHEAAGIVEKTGKSVSHVKPGDHVVIEAGVPCRKCDLCISGHYNLCKKMKFKGCLSKYCAHPGTFCHKINNDVPLEHAAMAYQLSLGCTACHKANIKPNSNVAVIGSDTTALCAAMCAQCMGADNVCVLCSMTDTEDVVQEFVTDKVEYFDCSVKEANVVETIKCLLGSSPDIVINCSCCTKTMNISVMALKPMGTCVVAGFVSECAGFNTLDAMMKEIRIVSGYRSKSMFPVAISLLESGRVPIDCVLADCCGWDQLEGAFHAALSEANTGPRRIVIFCQMGDASGKK